MYQLRSRVVGALCASGCLGIALPAIADGYNGGYSPRYNPTNWTGLYIGAHGGYAWGDFDGPLSYDDAALFPASIFDSSEKSIDADGWLGGFQAGFNKQFGTVVVGLEADVSWTDNDGRGTFLPYPAQGPDPAWNIETDDTDHFHADLELHSVRVGLNYQFGGDREAPVPLK